MSTAFGPYELLEHLGEGGMAEVWSARKRGSGGFERVVCIKRIRFDQRGDAETAERFLREARLLGRLHHANIAQIYDAGRVGDEYFIEMEYIHGRDLRTLLKAQIADGPPPPGLALSVAMDVGRALEHAHRLIGPDGEQTPIVHRDVTAANVMLGFDGAVRLVDFGLAKTATIHDPQLTAEGIFLGTTGYIAPELQRGAAASPQSDQFSLAVVFYETLTGRRLLDRVVARERPPSQCNAAVPATLDAVCLRGLADEPHQRFSSCASFVDAIDAAAPRLAIGAVGIARLLEKHFGASKLEGPRSATIPPVRATTAAAEPMKPQPATRAERPTVKIDTQPRQRPTSSNIALWLVGAAAGALLVSAIVYRLRDATPPSAPTVATRSPAMDAATTTAADAAIVERDEGNAPKTVRRKVGDLLDPFPMTTEPDAVEQAEPTKRKRGSRRDRDLMNPFSAEHATKKKKKPSVGDEDLSLVSPEF